MSDAPPRRRGRPPVEHRKIPLTVWLPPPEADALAREALKRDVSVSALLRARVARLRRPPEPPR